MIIQNSALANQAAAPAARVNGTAGVAAQSPAAAGAPERHAEPHPSADTLASAVATLNQAMQESNRNLEFSVDTGTKKVVVRMVDTSTGELIRQIPSDETLAISRGIEQFQLGLLLKQKA